MTELTDNIDIGRGILFYDAGCGVCRGGMRRFGGMLTRRGFRLLPLQSPVARQLTGAAEEDLMREAHLVTPAPRRVLRGADAVVYLARAVPWAAPLRWLAALPGGMPVMRAAYARFARNRYGISAACELEPRRRARVRRREDRAGRWAPPLLWLALALLAGPHLPAWAWMWASAVAIYLGCKWATFWPHRFDGSIERRLGYLLAYGGMDAAAFFGAVVPPAPRAREWLATAMKMAVGAAMVWLAPRLLVDHSAMLAGWAGMVGLTLLLHFGLFDLVALGWREHGVAAGPLMSRPVGSTSLADFWGRRWNSGFRDLAHALVFSPAARVLGATGATAVVFLVSGVVHDVVISVAARGGYGRPTLYFLLQLAGLLLERTRPLRRAFRRPLVGRLFAILFVVAPLPLLFHGPFVRGVIIPFLHAIGGLS